MIASGANMRTYFAIFVCNILELTMMVVWAVKNFEWSYLLQHCSLCQLLLWQADNANGASACKNLNYIHSEPICNDQMV